MNQKRLWMAAGIIAIVIIAGFMLSVPHTTRDVIKLSPTKTESIPQRVVVVRDLFKKGIHTISGSLIAPDACSTASTTATLMGDASSTQTILVAISMPPTTGVCLEIPQTLTFSTTITAPAALPVEVTINGVSASTTGS